MIFMSITIADSHYFATDLVAIPNLALASWASCCLCCHWKEATPAGLWLDYYHK
jgi:hypothetical protein